MAINKSAFRTRTLTAVVFAAIMLAGLFINFWTFLLLVTIIHLGCWLEYLKITEYICETKIDPLIKYFFVVCGFTLMIIAGLQHNFFDSWIEYFGFKISLKIIFWLVLFIGLIAVTFQNEKIPFRAKKMMLAGFLYITLPLTAFLFLKEHFYYFNYEHLFSTILTCVIILSIWINDTMAYIVGSLIGKTPFSKISPKKTWEGTIGGGLMCILTMGLIGFFLPAAHILPLRHWLGISFVCAVFAPLGDLLESKLKRMAGIKDSGSFMPGHGGFLDRFDSLLIALPFVWLYAEIFIF